MSAEIQKSELNFKKYQFNFRVLYSILESVNSSLV